MSVNRTLHEVTERIMERSERTRAAYLMRMKTAAGEGPRRAHLTCGNQAHAYAAMGQDQKGLAEGHAPNIGIISAYNDMLSAHQPFAGFPDIIKTAARAHGATAQVAGGVPAMCDGVTQGQTGMELSLISRDVIAMASGIALSHNTFDAAIYLGVCDKIVPGLVIAAATFGYLPGIFLPAGPMPSGLPNDEKAKVRQKFATGEVSREELMRTEMASYHSPGTCTFYGTANSNQMLMEVMGLHLPGTSFVNPGTEMRKALTVFGVEQLLRLTALGNAYRPVFDILDEKAFVNGIVGLMATGGSTNLVLHLPAMAQAAGIILTLQDFEDIAAITPLMAKVYPNGLTLYTKDPKLTADGVRFVDGPSKSLNDKILRPVEDPFQETGGLKRLSGSLGEGIMKISAVSSQRHIIKAPVRIFHTQEAVKEAFKAGEFTQDTIIVVRFQGPKANGMPELHSLTPTLSVLQDRGLQVALVTDGRMSGASGKVPAAIHMTPEAAAGGPLAKLQDGDIVSVDAVAGTIDVLESDFKHRTPLKMDLRDNQFGTGRELFSLFRQNAASASEGGGVFRFF